VTISFSSLPLLLPTPSFSFSGVGGGWCVATGRQRGEWEGLGHLRLPFYSVAMAWAMADGGWDRRGTWRRSEELG
jgi:hypothetical protein